MRPGGDEATFVLLPTVNCALMSRALAEFAAETGAGADQRIVLVLDQAGFHTGAGLVVPEGIHLVFTPPYSPELQPAERLWSIIDEPLANRAPRDIDDLENILVERCRTLQSSPELFAGHIAYHWWTT